jgi:hypothetical protein
MRLPGNRHGASEFDSETCNEVLEMIPIGRSRAAGETDRRVMAENASQWLGTERLLRLRLQTPKASP